MRATAGILVGLGLLVLITGKAGAMILVEDGKPAATIVLRAQPTEVEERSAAQLQEYVMKMSGAKLEISRTDRLPAGNVIIMGRHPETLRLVGDILNDEHLGYDGVILKTFPGKLIVVGNKGRGQYYATYTLLKRLGCRFYLPHPDGEVIPRKSTIEVGDLHYVHKPDFAHRVLWCSGHSRSSMVHPEWYGEWAIKTYQGGVNIQHGHNYAGFCSPKKYFKTHPEYFPLLPGADGRMERSASGQLCLSNPEVVDLAVQAAIAAFDNDPSMLAYSLSPNDTGGWCECDKCKAMDSPDPKVGLAWRVMKFNNEVAARVAERYPDKLVCYYAEYGNMPGPPLGMKAHPNVMAAIVNIYDLMHDINDPDSAPNVEYRKRLHEWKKIVRQMFMYEWYMYSTLPSPQVYVVGPRIRYYRDLGVIGYSGEVIGRSPDTDLALYIVSQMLWDADQDPQAMLDEFFDLYFGAAGEQMRRYYDILHETSYYTKNYGVRAEQSAWTPQIIKRLYAQLERAFEAADSELVRRRLWREQMALAAYDRIATAYYWGDKWARGDKSARDRGLRAINAVIAYMDKIKGQDIISDSYIKQQALVAKRTVFEAENPVPRNSARRQPGWDDESTFGDIWDKYEELGPVPEVWKFKLDPDNVGVKEKWYAADLDDSSWDDIRIREFWEAQGYDYNGTAWYRVELAIPASAAGRKVILYFGAADEEAWVWVNGRKAGEHTGNPNALWDKRFPIDITDFVIPGQKNQVTVRVHDGGYMGGLWKNIKLVSPKS